MAETSEEERFLETQLELQLQDQRDSLAAINEALASDPSNSELLAVSEELVEASKEAEEGLFHLKRARLLREADSALLDSRLNVTEDAKAETFEPAGVEPEPLEDQSFGIGSKCRFRHTDGRWYNGTIVALEGHGFAKISFLTPTSENMLMCKFFLQQRCRFGTNCRSSHGFDIPLSSLKKYVPTIWDQSLVGSRIWATSDICDGLWREAELNSYDTMLGIGKVVFRDDGSSTNLGDEAIAVSEFAEPSDEEETDLSSDETGPSDYDDEGSRGLGFLDITPQSGIQKETVIFAKWENHTRGIASKMMANMGYQEGMGLGASGQGIVNPVLAQILPAKQSLDHALGKEGKIVKKRSRGGKRKRDRKFADLTRAAKEREETAPGVFSIINCQLAKHGKILNGSVKRHRENGGLEEVKKVDRRSLIGYDSEVKDLRMRVEKLEEMAKRNRREKPVYDAVMMKLTETRRALADAQAAHASASNSVTSRENEKKWLKF